MSFVSASSSSIQSTNPSFLFEEKRVEVFSSSSSESLFFPEEHVSDRLMNILVHHQLIDVFGNVSLKLPPLALSGDILQRVKGIYTKPRTMNFVDNNGYIFEIEYSLKELCEYLDKGVDTIPHGRRVIVGGVLLRLLGEAYCVDFLGKCGIKDPEKFFSREFSAIFKTAANDEDIRLFYPNATWDELQALGNSAITFFMLQLSKKYGYYINPALFEVVKKYAFNKFYHFHSPGLHYLTISPKDPYNTDLCLIAKMSREHLFLQDALGMDITGLTEGKSDQVFLTSDLSTPNIAIIHRLLGIVDADEIKKINHNGWPLYISHLCRGKICLKREVEAALTEEFVKKLSGGERIPSLSSIINKVFDNHFGEGSKHALPLYVINALVVGREHLSDESFANFKHIMTECIVSSSEQTLYHCLGRLLKSQTLSFEVLKAFVELFVFNIYMDEEGAEGIPCAVMRRHCGKEALQLTIQDGLGNFLLVPLNPVSALEAILRQISMLSQSDVMDLSQLYAFLKPSVSFIRNNNRLVEYLHRFQLKATVFQQESVDMLRRTSPLLWPFICDLMLLLLSLEMSDHHLHQFLEIFPDLLGSCGSSEQRQGLNHVLRELFVRFYVVASRQDYDSAIFVSESDAAFFERIALLLCSAGRNEYYVKALHLFKISRSPRLKEFVEGVMPDGIAVASKALNLAFEESRVPHEELLEVWSILANIPLLGPEQVNELSRILTRLFKVNSSSLNGLLIPAAFQFLQNTGVLSNPALSDLVLSRASKEKLNEREKALFLKLCRIYFEHFLPRATSNELQMLMKNYETRELDSDVIFRCRLQMLTNRLKGMESLTKGTIDEFIDLLQMEEWGYYKRDIISCYRLIINKFQDGSGTSSQSSFGNNLLLQFLSNPALEKLFVIDPRLVVLPALGVLKEKPKASQRANLLRLMPQFLSSLFHQDISSNDKIEYFIEFLRCLEGCLPKDIRTIGLSEYMKEALSLIQCEKCPDMMIRFLQVCDIHGLLLPHGAIALDSCLWAFEEGIGAEQRNSCAKLVQRLLENGNVPVVGEGYFDTFLTVVFNHHHISFNVQSCIFWIGSLDGREVSISFEKIFVLANVLFDQNRMKEGEQILEAFANYPCADVVRYSDFWFRIVEQTRNIGGISLAQALISCPIAKISEDVRVMLGSVITSSHMDLVMAAPMELMDLLIRYKIYDPIIWCNVFEEVSRGDNIECKRMLWSLIDGILDESDVFKEEPQLRERAYLAAARCLKYNDRESCLSLLIDYLSSNSLFFGDAFDSEFQYEFFCGLAINFVNGVKVPLSDEDAGILISIYGHRSRLLNLFPADSKFLVELDKLMLDRLTFCKQREYYLRLWGCFKNLMDQPSFEKRTLLAFYEKLLLEIPFYGSELPGFFLDLVCAITKGMIAKYSLNFNYVLLFETLANMSNQFVASICFPIMDCMNSLIMVGKQINLLTSVKAIENLIRRLINSRNFKIVNHLLNLPCVMKSLNVAPTQQKALSSTSRSKKVMQRKAIDETKLLSPLMVLRNELISEMLSSLVTDPPEITDQHLDVMIGVIKQMPYFINTNREMDFFYWLLKILFSTTDQSGNLDYFKEKVNNIFGMLKECMFTREQLIFNNLLDCADRNQSDTRQAVPASCSSSSSPSVVSDTVCQSTESYLISFNGNLICPGFEEKKRLYSTWILFFLDKLLCCETKNSEFNLYILNVGYKILMYLYDQPPERYTPKTIFRFCKLYFEMARAFADERSVELHRNYCAQLIAKYQTKVNFLNQGEDSFSMIFADPQHSLHFKSHKTFVTQIELILIKLQAMNTPGAFLCALELLNLHFLDLYKADASKIFSLVSSLLVSRVGHLLNKSRKGYILDDAIMVLAPTKLMIVGSQYSFLAALQYNLLAMVLKKESYENLEEDLLKDHFAACVKFIMRRFESGGFTFDPQEFNEILSKLADFIEFLKQKEGSLITFIKPVLSSFIKYCTIPFEVNKDHQHDLMISYRNFLLKI